METTPSMVLPAIFADGMVIQRDRDFLVWGWTAPSTPVSARLEPAAGGEAVTASATSTADGAFAITMPAQPAGTGAVLTVFTSVHSVRIEDVSFGEIWVVGGQSNAQLPLRRVLSRFPRAIEDATDMSIRVFQAPEAFNFHGPQSDCAGMRWIRTGIAQRHVCRTHTPSRRAQRRRIRP
ncbi:hypothetical protein [Bifidobacterium magnum]|uniref:hypothetical protein n=1 Tax=Bifidobacterium magnum TaxID=1692 RepID=UPI001269CB59|nr:hypothetical protein [Bifidobacterium magnum]